MPSRSGRFLPPLGTRPTGALMHSSSHKLLFAGAAVCLWFSVPLAADPIYKWKGLDGVTHYSETPPAAATGVNPEVLELSPLPPSQPADPADYRALLEVADSLQAARLEREHLRLERRRAASGSRKSQQEAQLDVDEPRYVVPWFFSPPQFRPHPGRDRHVHPHPDQPRIRRPSETAPEPPSPSRAVVSR